MRRYLTITLPFVLMLLLGACKADKTIEKPLSMHSCAPMPEARTSATAFSIGGKVYVIGGRSDGNILPNTMQCYDPTSDQWTTINTPLEGRVHMQAVVVGEDAYLGLGFAGRVFTSTDSHYYHDWWRWTPATGQWQQLRNFPTDYTTGGIAAAADGSIYIVEPFGPGYTLAIYRYEITTDTWTETRPKTDIARQAQAGCLYRGQLYFGTGFYNDDRNDWGILDLQGQSFTRMANVPGMRSNAVAAAGDKGIYLSGGIRFRGGATGGMCYDDVLCYQPDNDQWVRVATLPDGAQNQSTTFCDGRIYIGLGETWEHRILNTLYCIYE